MQNTLWARCTKRVFYFFTAGRRRQCSLTLMGIAYAACGMASTRQTVAAWSRRQRNHAVRRR